MFRCIYFTSVLEMQNIMQSPDRWYSTKEICAYPGVSRDTLLTWISEKGLSAHKMGRNWKFKTAEIDEWVKSGKAGE